MAQCLQVHWTVRPSYPPEPIRFCAHCGQRRPFCSSGRIRLNANGRKLDAWLIYKCGHCRQTGNRPVFERIGAGEIDTDTLDAVQQNSPKLVGQLENDVVSLRRHCNRVILADDVTVTKPAMAHCFGALPEVKLIVEAQQPTRMRLDRLLARQFGLSRRAVRALERDGYLRSARNTAVALKMSLYGKTELVIAVQEMDECIRLKVLSGLTL